MQVFLQHNLSSCFLKAKDCWTPLSHEAMDFGTFERAVTFAQENQMTNVQIALIFPDTGQKIFLPVQRE
jgi:hypothetical protein